MMTTRVTMQETSSLTQLKPTQVCIEIQFDQLNTFFPAGTIEYSSLQLVHIYFDTATFDEIKRDKKITLTGQLGLIGGTMGLLTGFSILSAVEIFYFAIKFFFSLITVKIN